MVDTKTTDEILKVRVIIKDYLSSIDELSHITHEDIHVDAFKDYPAWYAFDYCLTALKAYLENAPALEADNLKELLPLLQSILDNPLTAASKSQSVIEKIEIWLRQTDLSEVDKAKAEQLVKATDLLLKTMPLAFELIPAWTRRLLLPSGINDNIKRLLGLSLEKFKGLSQIQQKTIARQETAKEENAQDKFHHLISLGIQSLNDRTVGLNTTNQALNETLNILKKLQSCFAEDPKETFTHFWQIFDDKKDFLMLLKVLMISGSEKEAWLRSFHHYHPANQNQGYLSHAINTSITSTSHLFFGGRIDHHGLKERYNNIVDSLFRITLDASIQKEVDDKLTFIIHYHQGDEIEKLKDKMQLILEVLKAKWPLGLKQENADRELGSFNADVRATPPLMFNLIRELRQRLTAARRALYKVRRRIRKKEKVLCLGMVEGIQECQKIIHSPFFSLTGIDKTELIDLSQQLTTELYQHLYPAAALAPQAEMLDKVASYHDQALAQIQHTRQQLTGLVEKLDGKCPKETEHAMSEISHYMAKRHGFWNAVLEFFSPTYRQCMKDIEDYLSDSFYSKATRGMLIASTLKGAKDNASFIVRWQLSKVQAINRYGFFMPYKPQEDVAEPLLSLKDSAPSPA